MSFDFVLMVVPETVAADLQSWAASGDAESADVLKLVKADLPLSQNADLLKYVFIDSYHFSLMQRLLVLELGQGRAAVYDAASGVALDQVLVTESNGAGSSARDFTTEHGERILWSLDRISN